MEYYENGALTIRLIVPVKLYCVQFSIEPTESWESSVMKRIPKGTPPCAMNEIDEVKAKNKYIYVIYSHSFN